MLADGTILADGLNQRVTLLGARQLLTGVVLLSYSAACGTDN